MRETDLLTKTTFYVAGVPDLQGLEHAVSGFGFRVSGFRFRVSIWTCKAEGFA